MQNKLVLIRNIMPHNILHHKKLLKSIHPSRILIPLLIGFGIVAFLFFKDYQPGTFRLLDFSYWSVIFLFLAFLCMLGRDLGYIIRLRVLSDKKLSWMQCFRIIMLWEFTSAVTPSAVGGTSIAVLFLYKENISLGRSTSIVLATSFLDEIYFVIMFPLLLLLVSPSILFGEGYTNNIEGIAWINELFWIALIGYSVKFLYVGIISYALFINPRSFKWVLLKVFKLPFLRRWRPKANDVGNEIVTSSYELKSKSFHFWLKAFGATFISWSARYFVINAIFLAFFIVPDHFLLFARQLVMWIMMLVSPTPGGSGFAEFVFTRYLSEFIPLTGKDLAAIAIGLAFLWRLASYYPYLLVGSLILPGWIRSKFGHHKHETSAENKENQ